MRTIVKIEKNNSISRMSCNLPEDTTGISYSQSENLLFFYSSISGRIGFIDENEELKPIIKRREISHPVGVCCDKWGICVIQFSQDMAWGFSQSCNLGVRICGNGTFSALSKLLPKDANDFAPYGICRTSNTSIIIPAPWGNRLLIIEDGKISDPIGSGKRGFSSSSSFRSAMFSEPSGVCVDEGSGRMFISDTGNSLIRVFQDKREIAFLGMPNVTDSVDGFGTEAKFSKPKMIKTNKGEVVVVDNNLIRSFQASSLEVKTIYASSNNIADLAIGGNIIYVLEK